LQERSSCCEISGPWTMDHEPKKPANTQTSSQDETYA